MPEGLQLIIGVDKRNPVFSIYKNELTHEVYVFYGGDRKSTRLNSSHTDISRMPSSAWKKKKQNKQTHEFT